LRTGLGLMACGECLREPPAFLRTRCAVDYVFPWVQLLQAFKFEGQDDLSRPLARLLAQVVDADGTPSSGRPDLLLPVPLSQLRLRERGYNQAWELARQVGKLLHVPARADLLQRSQHGAAQSGLTRAQRQRNLLQAFSVSQGAAPTLAGRRVALVDDVMTTGATAHAAAQVLCRAGVASVEVWVVARTPSPHA
jgi:ComF family protein